ncbi:hypothetical protein [Mucilaginibacter sp. L196]|uniref:hypothetical protein n=1 Tax=Mucilaginibacter sp. L196 TaxID=1641870 RepID=UPI001C20BF66|nr:hypothetical protein [Mucilaginibacter sp. L196]
MDISITPPDKNNLTLPANNGSRKHVTRDPYSAIKKGIWIYFILLIFEGALRKWILPGLSSPLLLIRDPLAIWLVYTAWKRGVVVFNIYVMIIYVIGIVGLFTAIFWGHGVFLVALYGVRTLIVHFPIIFVIGNVFDREDVLKLGRFLTWLVLPMTLLIILQFYSPQSAWINRGIGGDVAGGGFTGALGFFRPPATFSFTNGTALFYSLSACFIFYFWIVRQKEMNKTILLCASIALLMSIPLSISRTLFFSILVTVAFVLLAVLRSKQSVGKVIIIVISVLTLFVLLSQLSVFKTATEAFSERFTSASKSEGGVKGTLQGRYLGGMFSAITNSDQLPFFGMGIGIGTSVGGALISGKAQFLVAEGEWGRLIGEMGIIMGLTVIVIRLGVTGKIALECFKFLSKGDFLPWILLSFCVLTLPQAQWSQPTSLGFSIFGAGIVIASMRSGKSSVIKNLTDPAGELTSQN